MDDNNKEPYQPRSARHQKHHKVAPTSAIAKQEAAAHKQAAKAAKSQNAIRIRPILAALFLIMILFLGAAAGYGFTAGNGSSPIDISTLPADQQQKAKEDRALGNLNILLVGCDQRDNETARADTIMLVTLRPVDKEASILSIPRDTLVKIKGNGTNRINHALAYGGMDLLRDTVENFLDIKIDYHAQVNFEGFINVIDALGGVTIDVETRMYKPLENIDLKPGVQKLNGYDALAYVRWRGDGRADLGRIDRQQKFIATLVDGLKNMSLKEALNVGGAAMDSIQTDMSVAQMTKYGAKFLGITPADIEAHSLIGAPVTVNGAECLKVDQKTLTETMNLMKYGNPEPTTTETETKPTTTKK